MWSASYCSGLNSENFWRVIHSALLNKKTPVGFFCITLSVFLYTDKNSFYDIFFSEFQWQIQRDCPGNKATPPPFPHQTWRLYESPNK